MSSIIMISVAVFLILYIFWEIPQMLHNRDWKILIVSSLLLVLSLLYGIDFAMDLNKLPNPNKALYLVKPVSEDFERLFQIND